MNPAHDQNRCVNDADRCRLGRLLVGEACTWGDQTCRAKLEIILEQATPVETRATPEDVVTMNTRVKLAALPTDKLRTVTVVYPDDLDLASDGVSILEPMGTALLGSKVGDVVQFAAGKGASRFRIVEIIYQPEHAGEFHL
jgi:regulator of nucleoside diphosphate kinase